MPSLFTREPAPPRASSPSGNRTLPYAATWWARYFPTRKKAKRAIFYLLLGSSALFGSLAGIMLVDATDLPQMQDLERYRPDTTTQLLDVHGRPFGSFALERRVVIPYSEIPPVLHDAILSIEDKTFESNAGVNLFRVIGAAVRDMRSHGRKQGASTLTMQLARNLFLSAEQTWTRKFQEVMLTIQIERHFTKQQIFALYVNQIYLGSGSYGFEAASEYYFSKHVRDLTLPEAALLAGLPKGPESYSPLRHPERAVRRRNLVLAEMLGDHKINHAQYEQAVATPLVLHIQPPAATIAPYFVEEVRRQLDQEYGADAVQGEGLKIYTTLDLDLQLAANKAVLDGLAAYERRHGWKGKLVNVLASGQDLETYNHPDWIEHIANGAYFHAVVIEANKNRVIVRIGRRYAEMTPADWAWTTIPQGNRLMQVGDIVYVRIEDATSGTATMHASLQQDSGAQAALMAIDNSNGEIVAMVGGRDFDLSQFNRATQAERQVGSSFKPYDYTAAVEILHKKPYDIVLDEPTSFYTPNGPYTPHDYEKGYRGPMTLIDAFAESRNIPALRLANEMGIRKVIEVAHRFGITANLPNFLPVAIGAAGIKLEEQVGAYSVFPNDGILVQPHAIRRIVQADGLPLNQATPKVREVISVETARTMMTLLKAVPQVGTAAIAGQTLKHPIGGKTGTTNNYTDAWFLGFSPSVTCGTWVGFDSRQSLGEKETGAKAALPIWIDFMKVAIARSPNESFPTAAKKTLAVAVSQNPDSGGDATPAPRPAHVDSDAEDAPANENQSAPAAAPVQSAPAFNNAVPDDTDSAPAAHAPAAPHPAPNGTVTPGAKAASSAGKGANGRPMVESPFGPYRPYQGHSSGATKSHASPSR